MHFGPSSGEPCPFWLEPINPATLGKKGKLGLEARLPEIQKKALHRQMQAAAMRNQGNGIKKPSRQTAEHCATDLPQSKRWNT